MINYYFKTINDTELKKIKSFKSGAWIYAYEPSEGELDILSNKFSLEKGHLTDALDKYEVPRVEVENDHTYIFVRYPVEAGDKGEITTIPLLVVVANNFVLTLSSQNLSLNEKITSKSKSFSTTQKTKLILQILSETNRAFNSYIYEISRGIRKTRIDLKGKAIKNKDIIKLVQSEMTLNDFISALVPITNNLEILTSGKTLKLYDEDRDLIEDLNLSSYQLLETSKSSIKNIANIREASNTIMTNNLNKTIKFLTALTVVLNIPVLISSIYGMNVNLPFAQSPFAFLYLMSLASLISLLLIIIFAKMDWF